MAKKQPIRDEVNRGDQNLDEHVNRVVDLHFDDEDGSPFYLGLKDHLSFDPVEDINGYEDLVLFAEDSAYDHEELKEALRYDTKSLVPQKFDNSEYNLYSTGGRTGTPKWTAFVEGGSWDRIADMVNERFDDAEVERGQDLAFIGPTGPHVYGHFVKDLASNREGQFLVPDLDPRWMRTAMTEPSLREQGIGDEYASHLQDQTKDIFKQHGRDLGILISTPTVIGMLAEGGALDRLDLDSIIFAGQAMKPENYRAMEDMFDGSFEGWYGNTLMGIAPQEGFDEENGQIVYQPQEALAGVEVMDPESDGFEKVEYGERGQTMINVLREGLFAPFLMEDDEATRLEPTEGHELDAVGNPDIPTDKQDEIEEGVY
jgi:phenylacetate-coenzyme A ligase PaaK-like adenylate-forming protein